MNITPELAKRIVERKRQYARISEQTEMEIIMDWLAGDTYKEIMKKHNVSKSKISDTLNIARGKAKAVLEKESKSDKARAS